MNVTSNYVSFQMKNKYQMNMNSKDNPIPKPIPQGQDTVSFKGAEKLVTTAKSKNFLKATVAAFLAFLGVKAATKETQKTLEVETKPTVAPKEKPVENIYPEGVSEEAKKFGNQYLHKIDNISYFEDYTGREVSYDIPVYPRNAIVKAVELYDKEPALARKIIELSKNSSGLVDLDFVVDQIRTKPEMIKEYEQHYNTFVKQSRSYGYRGEPMNLQEMYYMMKALDSNKEITDLIISKLDKDDLLSYDKIFEITQLDPSVAKKYIDNPRLTFRYDDIIELSGIDTKYSKEVDELIDLREKAFSKQDRFLEIYGNDRSIKEMLPIYKKDPKTVTELINLTCFHTKGVERSIEEYKKDPEFFKAMIDYYNQSGTRLEWVLDTATKYTVPKFEEYKTILNYVSKDGWQSLSKDNFNAMVKFIMKAPKKFEDILENSELDESAKKEAIRLTFEKELSPDIFVYRTHSKK